MASRMRNCFLTALIIFVLVGCAGGGDAVSPETQAEIANPIDLTSGREIFGYEGNHYLLFHNLVYFDTTNPDAVEFEIVPLREGFMHLNILMFLEVAPCTDCFKIVGLNYPEPGVLDVDIEITHPFPDPDYTCFDLRSIVMFNGSHTFLDSGLTMSDPSLGDGALLNAEGYTTHYNTWQIGNPPGNLQKYFPGKLATQNLPDSMVNGYIRHISDDPSNTRNALYAGDSVTRTYSLKLPEGEAVLGYSVDANWAVPIETPVDDPMTDFGPNASSPEPWKIVVMETPVGEGLTDEGGETNLTIDVYDWQGIGSHAEPVIECPELFTGTLSAALQAEFGDFTRYLVLLGNYNQAGGGIYNCLISVQDNDYNPNFPWLDLKAYQVFPLGVTGHPVASASLDPLPQDIGLPVHFNGSSSYDPYGGEITLYEWDWDLDGIYDETGIETDHTWDSGGVYYVQLRVTDDEGLTDVLDSPLEVGITEAGIPYYPVDVTPPLMNMLPEGFEIVGDYLYFVNEIAGLYILDISDPGNPFFYNCVEYKSYSSRLLDIEDGYAYVFYSPDYDWIYEDGIYIIDISDPGEAYIAEDIKIDSGSRGAASDGYLYVTKGPHDYTEIFDVDPPEGAHTVGFAERGDEIVIDGDYLYIWYYFKGLYWPWPVTDILNWYNLADPVNTEFLGSHPLGGVSGNGSDVLNNLLFVSYNAYLEIWEVGPTSTEVLANTIEGVSPGNVWTDGVGVVGVSNMGVTTLIDVDSVEDSHVVNTISGALEGFGNGVYSVLRSDGLFEIWDVDPPESAENVSKIEWLQRGGAGGLVISGDYAYVGDSKDGYIYVLDINPLEDTHVVNTITLTDNQNPAVKILQSGNYLLAAHWMFLDVIDITDPETAEVVHTKFAATEKIEDLAISGGYAFMANGETGMVILDITPPESAWIISIDYAGDASSIDVSNGYAYVGDSSSTLSGLRIIDIYTTDIIKYLEGAPVAVEYYNGYVVMINYEDNGKYALQIVDVDPPEQASIVISIVITDYTHPIDIDLAIHGQYAFVGTGMSEGALDPMFYIYDIFPPEETHLVSSIETWGGAMESVVVDDTLYLTCDEGGLRIYDLW